MGDDGMFSRTPQECAMRLAEFIVEETRHRAAMLRKHPDKTEYWQVRLDQAMEASRDLATLSGALKALDAVAELEKPAPPEDIVIGVQGIASGEAMGRS